MKLDPYLTLLTKINPKWINDLNIRLEITKFLRENIGTKFFYVGAGQNHQQHKSTKEKFNKRDYIKLKSFAL